jgi:hypothetical protein
LPKGAALGLINYEDIKDIVQLKRGGSRGLSIDFSQLRTQSTVFFDAPKGKVFCFK